MPLSRGTVREAVANAVAHFWRTRELQRRRQESSGRSDQGARGAVTGGAQMDGFVEFAASVVIGAGAEASEVHYGTRLELPGFFRPTKEWDLVVVIRGKLVAAIEFKSHAGPSFGNNVNNRIEEATGSALDIWTAFREGAFGASPQPWLGYLMLLEDCEGTRRPIRSREPHFPVLDEFKDACYARRYELFCRKLVRERHYTAAALVTSTRRGGRRGEYNEPADDLALWGFFNSLHVHVASVTKGS